MSVYLLSSEKKVIKFAPLPMTKASKNIEKFLFMNMHLEKKLNVSIEYIQKKDYQKILDGFKDGSIDIAYLGPLPFVSLKKQYKYVKPIVVFKQKDGSSKYRCVLSKFKNDKFDKNKQIKVALTQPLSTCGYLMTNILLKEKYNIELSEQKYDYTMSHTNALLSVMKEEFLIAGAKKSIAQKFKSLGMEIIAQSELLPGFSLVANTKTLSKEQIEKIQSTLLALSKEDCKKFGGAILNGVEKVDVKEYDSLHVDFEIPKKGNI